MRWLISRLRRDITSPQEAAERDRHVERSVKRAQADKARTEAMLTEANQVKEKLQQHNAANAYGLWLERLLVERQRRA